MTHPMYWERRARKRSLVLAANSRLGRCYRDAVADQVSDQPSGAHSRWRRSDNEQRPSRRGWGSRGDASGRANFMLISGHHFALIKIIQKALRNIEKTHEALM